ncbi:MAG: hypothetical protein IPI76_00315 [Chloracidobacterium sp.]|nr:hypothetical protein [Chloracidobacterium sp.]
MNDQNDTKEDIKWRRVEKLFIDLLINDNYDQWTAEQLGFCISQILEDAMPLIQAIERSTDILEHDRDELLNQLHMLFNNHQLFVDGYSKLMR